MCPETATDGIDNDNRSGGGVREGASGTARVPPPHSGRRRSGEGVSAPEPGPGAVSGVGGVSGGVGGGAKPLQQRGDCPEAVAVPKRSRLPLPLPLFSSTTTTITILAPHITSQSAALPPLRS